MKDLLQKALTFDRHKISKEQFSEWKHNPVTEALFTELIAQTFDQFDDSIPTNSIEGLPLAYKRDGARELLDTLWDWKPEFKEGDDD